MSGLDQDILENMEITILTKDNQQLTWDREAAKQSQLMSVLMANERDENTFHLNVNYEILEYIKEYTAHHKNNPAKRISPLIKSSLRGFVSEWDYCFITGVCHLAYEGKGKVSKENRDNAERLLELVRIANYMDIEPLVELCAAYLASIIKCYEKDDPQFLKTAFGEKQPYTEEQHRIVREKVRWNDPDYDPTEYNAKFLK